MKRVTILLVLLTLVNLAIGQISIKGNQCAMKGLQYEYAIFGNPDSSVNLKVCLEGGQFVTGKSGCQDFRAISIVKVIWDSSSNNGKISIQSKKGNSEFSVRLADQVAGGKIDSAAINQLIRFGGKPGAVKCSSATGGSCAPSFNYQWQISSNAVVWADIPGATSKDLDMRDNLKETVFVRRKATETQSMTVSFSDVAAIYVGPK